MYIDPKILILISVVVFFALIACLSCLWIISRQKKRFITGRYRDLALTPLNSQDSDASAQALASQRVLRERLNELEKLEKSSYRTRVNNLILRSGLKYNYQRYVINSLIICVTSFVLFFILTKSLFIAIVVALLLGAFGQNMYLSSQFKRRQKQFTADFSGALDIIVRGVTVGLSINESMKAVAYEAQGPVSEEFRRIVDGQAMGLEFEDVLEDAIHRMPTAEFRFFSIVMQIQRQTGGSMAKTLADLSALLRGRKEMRDKIMALSSEAKSSAFIIGCLPLFVTGILFLMSPEFLDPLLNQPIGQVMIGAGLALMLIGIFVMRAMINFKF